MHKLFRWLVFSVVTAGVASSALAGEVTVKIGGGRATVIAKDVTLRQILAEWARVGDTRIVNAEKLTGGPMSLELIDVPEKEALDILLRSAAGYMTGPRPAGIAGASLYDRVMILATSKPPATTAVNTPPSPFTNRTAIQQVPPQPLPDDDDGDPGDQRPMQPPVPGMLPFGANNPNVAMPFPGQLPPQSPNANPNNPNNPNANPNNPNNPNANPNTPNANPNTPNVNPNNPNAMPTQAPITAPRPGQLPQPQPINPYSPMGRPPNQNNGRGGGPGSGGQEQ
jgi:hypothetical protein